MFEKENMPMAVPGGLPLMPMNDMAWLKPGYAYVVPQMANEHNVYPPEKGLKQGTLFPELDKPLGVYGMEGGQ